MEDWEKSAKGGSMDEHYEQFNKYEIPTLDELIIIKDGQIMRLKPEIRRKNHVL